MFAYKITQSMFEILLIYLGNSFPVFIYIKRMIIRKTYGEENAKISFMFIAKLMMQYNIKSIGSRMLR